MKKLFVKKRFTKEDKEKAILFGLIELYIKTNVPIGSNSLKLSDFEDMSSATIRNYFAELEKKGFLIQQHLSGGRIPTAKAFKEYANYCIKIAQIDKKDKKLLEKELTKSSKKITDYINSSLELLSKLTNLSVFQSSPRFDQDLVNNVKLLALDNNKLLCVILTDFGLIKTEVLYSNEVFHDETLRLIEDFFLWRMNKKPKPTIDDPKLLKLSQHLYNEMMVRYIVGYANYNSEDIITTGLAKLLAYPEFEDPATLAEGLSIFENMDQMRLIMQKTIEKNSIQFFIGNDFEKFGINSQNITLICIPYYIANIAVGTIGILCPLRIPYKYIFAILKTYSDILSENLTKNISKYKITFRSATDFKQVTNNSILLEDKSS